MNTYTTDTYPPSFTVRDFTDTALFRDIMGTAPSDESEQHLIERITALDRETGEMFYSKRSLEIEPLFKLLLQSRPETVEALRSFIALSYSWHDLGTWTPTPGCELDKSQNLPFGIKLPISNQCFQEVLKLRKPGEGIWVDQLCVNQEDEQEKEHAIALMDLVYKHARLIVIVVEDTTILESEASVIQHLQELYLQSDEVASFKKLLSENEQIVWNVISKIGCSRWFQRAWCFHEFQLCREAVFVIPREDGSPISLQLGTLHRVLEFKRDWLPTSVKPSEKSREGYQNLVFLLTSRYILSKKLCFEKPVVGICYLVNNLQASVLGDKVSIALNLLNLGSCFRGTVLSEGHCRYIFTLLALAAGDPFSLCCSGETLDHDGYERTKTSLDLICLQWPATSDLVHFSNRYPEAIRQLSNQISFQNGRMLVDVLVLPNLDHKPSRENLDCSEKFLRSIFNDPKILASIEPEELANPILDKEKFLKNSAEYLACAIELGFDWISKALKSMECSSAVSGLRSETWDYDSLWHSAKMHLLTNMDESLKETLVDFLIFAFQHVMLLGKTAQNIGTITFESPEAMRAIVSLPPNYRAEDVLLVVPVSLSGPKNSFIQRLWLLDKGEEEPNVLNTYSIRSKGYIWGFGALCEGNGTTRLSLSHSSSARIAMAGDESKPKIDKLLFAVMSWIQIAIEWTGWTGL